MCRYSIIEIVAVRRKKGEAIMKDIRKTMAAVSALTLVLSSVFSCSLSKKDESSEESVTEAQTTEEVTEAEAYSTPRLLHHVEGKTIELGTFHISHLQVSASVVGGKLTLGIRSCEALAPVAAKTRLRGYLELEISSNH